MDKQTTENTTEEKIKEAARKIFTKKGFSGTRTRDIAQEAGVNLALVSYYFRSKEKLFDIIMLEKVQKLFGIVIPHLTDPETTLERKLQAVVGAYTDILLINPDLPLFVLSEIKNRPNQFLNMIPIGKLVREASFLQQLQQLRPDIDPLQFLMSILGMILMPFVGMPVLKVISGQNNVDFEKLLIERKRLIPIWALAMVHSK